MVDNIFMRIIFCKFIASRTKILAKVLLLIYYIMPTTILHLICNFWLVFKNNITGIQNFESLWRPFWPLHRTSNYSPQIDDQSSCHVTSLTTIYDSFSKAFPFVFMHDNKLLCTLNYFEWSLKGKKRPKSLDRISKWYQPLRSSTLTEIQF